MVTFKGSSKGGAGASRAISHITDPNWRYSNHVSIIYIIEQSNIQNTLIEQLSNNELILYKYNSPIPLNVPASATPGNKSFRRLRFNLYSLVHWH